ncbi:MAG: sodium:solute symporter [Pirellulales bacterium]
MILIEMATLSEMAILSELTLGFLDLAVLIGYMGGIGMMGLYFARRNTSTEEYFVGGRSHKGWVIGLSLVGTSISSISFLGFPADAYKTAYLRMLPNFMLPVALVVAAYVFLPFFRKNHISSAYEYLEMRFGPRVRVYGAVAFIIGQLMRISGILFLVSIMIQTLTNLDSTTCIIIAGIFVAFYTIVGGIHAVIWTDVIQTIVLALGGVVCLVVILNRLPGGLGQIIEVASAAGKFSFAEFSEGVMQPVRWDLTLQSKTAGMMLLIGLTIWLREYSCMQATIQRYAAARTSKDARTAMWVCGLTSIPTWLFFMFIGTSLYVFYQEFPTEATTNMLTGANEAKAEDIMPFFILHQLPQGMKGLVIAAALAAAMSSIDSSINAISAVSIIDIYRRHLVKDRHDSHYLAMARWIAVATGILMILGAIWFANSESKTMQDTLTMLTAVLGGGLFGLYMFGMLTTRGNGMAALCGIVCTILFTVWTLLAKSEMLPDNLSVPFDLYYVDVVGNVVMFIIGYLAGLWFFPNQKQLANLTIWTHEDVVSND